jgi:hypothetical protein
MEVYNDVGYFSGETYIFGLLPLFKDGYHGLVIPVTGYSHYDGGLDDANEDGIFRFSAPHVHPPSFNGNTAVIKKVLFNFLSAINFGLNSTYIQENIVGFYPVRAKRNANMVYQGVCLKCWSGNAWIDDPNLNAMMGANITENAGQHKKCVPLLGRDHGLTIGYSHRGTASNDRFDWVSMQNSEPNKMGVFSMDYQVKKDAPPSNAFMKGFQSLGFQVETSLGAITGITPHWSAWHEDSSSTVNLDTSVKAYAIDGFNRLSSSKFASQFDEGSDPILDGLWWAAGGPPQRYAVNLPFAVPRYIGVDEITEVNKNLLVENKVNIYKSDPDPANYDYKSIYNPANERFFKIGGLLKIDSIPAIEAYGRGDCFIQRNYLKVYHALDNFSETLLDSMNRKNTLKLAGDFNNGYGFLMSFITEGTVNSQMRYEQGINKYFPSTGLPDPAELAWKYNEPESEFYNLGYSETLGVKSYSGFDKEGFFDEARRPTRIMYSGKHITGARQDGYRFITAGQRKDFDPRYGQIVKLEVLRDNLVSIQEFCINSHPINERAYTQGDQGGQFILGTTSTLPDKVYRISDMYGSQHQWAIVRTDTAIYGWDWMKRMVWKYGGNGFERLSESRLVAKMILDMTEQLGGNSDILNKLPDNPINQNGIHSVFDAKNHEVLFTLNLPEFSNLNSHTFCFSEKMDIFTSRYSFTPNHYINIMEDLYSFNLGNAGFWLHGGNSDYNRFYGLLYQSIIEVTVNPEGDTTKIFDNMSLVSNKVDFFRVDYTTAQLIGVHFPWIDLSDGQFWRNPLYKENSWHLPILRSNLPPADPDYDLGAAMRDNKMTLKLTYNSAQKMELRTIITNFRKSYT